MRRHSHSGRKGVRARVSRRRCRDGFGWQSCSWGGTRYSRFGGHSRNRLCRGRVHQAQPGCEKCHAHTRFRHVRLPQHPSWEGIVLDTALSGGSGTTGPIPVLGKIGCPISLLELFVTTASTDSPGLASLSVGTDLPSCPLLSNGENKKWPKREVARRGKPDGP